MNSNVSEHMLHKIISWYFKIVFHLLKIAFHLLFWGWFLGLLVYPFGYLNLDPFELIIYVGLGLNYTFIYFMAGYSPYYFIQKIKSESLRNILRDTFSIIGYLLLFLLFGCVLFVIGYIVYQVAINI